MTLSPGGGERDAQIAAFARLREHLGRDSHCGERTQWLGPLGLHVERRWTVSIWLPKIKWVWGYWR